MSINFEEVKVYLDARKNRKRFISFRDIISNEDLSNLRKLMSDYGTKEVEDTFLRSDDCNYYPPIIIRNCKRCGDSYEIELSKTKFIDFLRHPREFICCRCDKLIDKENRERYKKEYEEREKNKDSNFSEFVKNFLTPDQEIKWKENNTPSKKFNALLIAIDNCAIQQITDYIKSMQYYDFLKTQYWKVIANKKRLQNNFKCELCSSEEKIVAHHKNYDIHGYEHINLKELIALCNDCHSKFHDKVK